MKKVKLILSLFAVGLMGVVYAAGTYNISIDMPVDIDGYDVDLSGEASAFDFAGQFDQYTVNVDWDDGSSDVASDNLIKDPEDKNFEGTWSASHTYSATGTYSVVVELCHKSCNGAEGAGITIDVVDIVVEDPEPVLGCTDPEANNYNPDAEEDDNSCTYDTDPEITTGTLVVIKDVQASTTDQEFSVDVEGQVYSFSEVSELVLTDLATGTYSIEEVNIPEGYTFSSITDENPTISAGATTTVTIVNEIDEGNGGGEDIYGCTNPQASNYNPEATIDDESCIIDEIEYPYGLITYPVFDYDVESGLITLLAEYYDGDEDNDDIVQWAVRAGTCAANTNTVAGNVDGYSDVYEWDGMNFSSDLDTDLLEDGEYCFIFNPKDDGEVDVRETRIFVVEEEIEEPILGCTDSEANNYNVEATEDDGSCEYDNTSTTTPEVEEEDDSSSSRSGSRRRNTSSAPRGEVLGAFTGDLSCGMYLNSYLQMGADNDPEEVKKLQSFLSEQGYLLPLTGVFGPMTDEAVRMYQESNTEEILVPWVPFGYTDDPTGYVYKTTRWKINNTVCAGSEGYPILP